MGRAGLSRRGGGASAAVFRFLGRGPVHCAAQSGEHDQRPTRGE
ncbi:hypothetical protein WQQ_32860 [Hydrocarboniphaga effusa AP103]|uniref:Uncharacterized protein n=1 Tax=Hydrocarboniphaga effusa AP103 TaxID=1172194 RepID=I7ZCT7_9GAMM|nr:hypothetical protein WQQ_32860 [Hydrocarboniphaga effusa AP103]